MLSIVLGFCRLARVAHARVVKAGRDDRCRVAAIATGRRLQIHCISTAELPLMAS